ncbi:hypothetical protein Tco_0228838 [Tanacetum coccineum]
MYSLIPRSPYGSTKLTKLKARIVSTKAVSKFATPVIQSTINKALEKTPTTLAQSSSHAQSSLKAAESLSEYELKNILFEKMDKSRSYLTHDKHQALYDTLINSLCLDDVIARGQADIEKIPKKRDRDDKDPSAGPNQGKKTKRSRTKESESSKKLSTTKESSKGKSPTKTSKSGKSMTAKEPVEELAFEMASYDVEQTIDDVYDWFKQPPRPPTPDPEWNKRQVVDDQSEQPYFNNMVSAVKDLLIFDEHMVTLIYFSKYAMNRLKIDNLTQAHLIRPVFELLKGTCKSRLVCLTVTAEYFFNKDLEFLKSSDPVKKYTTSITKTKAALYEIVGIEDRINKFSKHKVYSTQKILSVVGVKVKKLPGYCHLEEIVVRRAHRQLYKFKEVDFVDLHLNNIEDMLLLAV